MTDLERRRGLMTGAEAAVVRFLYGGPLGRRPVGLVGCEADAPGHVGYAGAVEHGWVRRREDGVVTLVQRDERREREFVRLLEGLREASIDLAGGPWYRCDITLDGAGRAEFTYHREGTPFRSVRDLEPRLGGGVPGFVLRTRFEPAILRELADGENDEAMRHRVERLMAGGSAVPPLLLELFATLEWQGDVNNGGHDQYFMRRHEPMTGLERAGLYASTLAGLARIGQPGAAALYADALGAFAPRYPHVEAARQALGVPAAPEADADALDERYFASRRDIEAARAAYVRAHADAVGAP